MSSFSDSLPPTFVRDWCRFRHATASLVIAIVFYGMTWLMMGLMVDWKSINAMMEMDPIEAYMTYGVPSDVLVSQEMTSLSIKMFFMALVPMLFILPLRVAGSVGADTRVKGTNFLKISPLSTWQIVFGTWLAGFSQVLLVGLFFIPVVLVRAYVMPMGYEQDWYYLLALVLFGGFYCALYLFSSGLAGMLRFLFLALSIIFAIFLPFALNIYIFNTGVQGNVALSIVGDLTCMGLATLLLLLLAKRAYAAPAENTALPVRTLSFICLVVSFALTCISMYAPDLLSGDPEWGFIASFLGYLAITGAALDAILPVNAMPVHALKTCHFLPAWPQMPGVLQSSLFALVCIYAYAVSSCAGCVVEAIHGGYQGSVSDAFYLALPLALDIWLPLVISILIVDFMCRRTTPARPLLVLVMGFAFFMTVSFIMLILGISLGASLPESLPAYIPCMNVIYYPIVVLSELDADGMDSYWPCLISAVLECGLMTFLLALRSGSKSAAR